MTKAKQCFIAIPPLFLPGLVSITSGNVKEWVAEPLDLRPYFATCFSDLVA
jgi:hypothetical protein